MSWSIGLSSLTREQLEYASKTMDYDQAYAYFNQLKGTSFGDIPDIMLEFANYNDAMRAVLDYGEEVDEVDEDYLKLEFPRLYDEQDIQTVLAEFNKLDFGNLENFDDYEDIRDVMLGLRDTFQYAHDNQQIIILYRMM